MQRFIPPGLTRVADEIERRGKAIHQNKWPKPPTEADVQDRAWRWMIDGTLLEAKAQSILTGQVQAASLLQRKAVEDELQREYYERRRPLLASIINKLLQQVYEAAIEIVEVRGDGTSKTLPREWAMSVSASRELEEGKTAHGQLYFKKVDSQVAHSSGKSCREPTAVGGSSKSFQSASGPIEQLRKFIRSNSVRPECAGFRKKDWIKMAKDERLEFSPEKDFPMAWRVLVQEKEVIPLRGRQKKEMDTMA